jgi:vacuolar-type H+-ATPase subunit D/Vma8
MKKIIKLIINILTLFIIPTIKKIIKYIKKG